MPCLTHAQWCWQVEKIVVWEWPCFDWIMSWVCLWLIGLKRALKVDWVTVMDGLKCWQHLSLLQAHSIPPMCMSRSCIEKILYSDILENRGMACLVWYLRDSTSLLDVDNSISWKWDSRCPPPSVAYTHSCKGQPCPCSLEQYCVLRDLRIKSILIAVRWLQYISLRMISEFSVCAWRCCERAELKQCTVQ